MYAELDRLLLEGIINSSRSEWSALVVIIRKANGDCRMCLDFYKLNALSKKDAYSLPQKLISVPVLTKFS